MFVSMWMTREVMTVEPHARLADAARTMATHRIRRLPVVDPQGQALIGILSARDILHAYPLQVNPFSESAPVLAASAGAEPLVADAMTPQPITVVPDTPLESAAELMSSRKIGGLPVLRDGKLVGLITESDLFRAFAAMLAPGGHGARITFDISAGEDIFAAMYELSGEYGMRITNLFTFHDQQRRFCVVQVLGWDVDRLIEAVWRKHHRVVSVLRFGSPVQEASANNTSNTPDDPEHA